MLTKDFQINDAYKKIGIKLSGGADSSIIYYMLCEHTKDKDVDIYVLSIGTPVKPWYPDGAKRVIDIVGKMTGKYPKEHLINMVPHSEYVIGQDKLAEKLRNEYGVDVIYSGLTMNVENNKFQNVLMSNKELWNLNETDIKNRLATRDKSRDYKVNKKQIPWRPFGHGDKMTTYEAYKINNMIDELYPYTYSCERMDVPIEEYKGIENMVHCNRCYFCFERWYAFGRLL